MSVQSMSFESPVSSPRPSELPSDSRPAVLLGPVRSIQAQGAQAVVSSSVAGGLMGEASRALGKAGDEGMLIGALPFDRHAGAHLVVPETTGSSWHPDVVDAVVHPAHVAWRVSERPSPGGYRSSVRDALTHLSAAAPESASESPLLLKVVLARMLEFQAPGVIDPLRVLARLAADPGTDAFCVPLPRRPGGSARTLVGASPELLIEKRGSTIRSTPMAGSAPRQSDLAADREAARVLSESAKNLWEHRLVVEFVLDTLTPYCRDIQAPAHPVLASTKTMWHLATPIDGRLKVDASSLELAAALHPTPAVCGTPRAEARALIGQLENFDRGFFTGAVGWCDAAGDGRWTVAIRCAEFEGATARLFAGAGIVAGSDPEAEVAETSAKLRTMLRALGIDEHGRPLASQGE
jgi:isochorismate synthase